MTNTPLTIIDNSERGERRTTYQVRLTVQELVEVRLALLAHWRNMAPGHRQAWGPTTKRAYLALGGDAQDMKEA